MRWFLVGGLLACLLCTERLWGGEPLRLEEVIEEALRGNPEIAAMREEIRVAAERIPQAGALPDPQVGAMFNGIPGQMMVPGRAEPDTRYDQIRITASQMFPLFGKRRLKAEAASKRVDVVHAKYEAKRLEIIAQVKSAYHGLFLARKAIEINRENTELTRILVKTVEAKYTVGKAPQQNVLKAQVSFSILLNQLITLEQQSETARARLNTLLNRALDAALGECVESESRPLKRSIGELEDLALEHNPKLQALAHGVEQRNAMHALARKQYYPDLMAGVQYWQNNERKDQMSMQVSINVPLWWHSKQNHGVREAAAGVEAAKAEYEAMKNMILFQVQDRCVKVQTAERMIELYETSILPQAEQALKAARIGYETDQVDFLTLVDSQKQLYALRLEYYQAKVDHERELALLEQAVAADPG